MNNYIINSGDKNSIILQGGSNKDKVGIQAVSTGSQVFVSSNNFLFHSSSNSEKAFHFKTENDEAGIILENGRRNKISLSSITNFDLNKFNMSVSEDSTYYYNGNLIHEFRNGANYIVSGKSVGFIFKENNLNFEVNMLEGKGKILFNNFKTWNSSGESFIFENKQTKFIIDKGDFNINTNQIILNSKNGIELLVENKGLTIGDSIILGNDNDVKIITEYGNLELLNKNGNKISIKPTGLIELESSKLLLNNANVNILSKKIGVEFLDSFLVKSGGEDSGIIFESGNFGIKLSNDFNLSGLYFKSSFQEYNFNDILFLNPEDISIKISNRFSLDCPEIDLHGEIITLTGKSITLNYAEQKISFDERGFKYILDDSLFNILRDEIKIISDGNLGLTLSGEKGGIRLAGNISWISSGILFLESYPDKILIGNEKINLKFFSKKSFNIFFESERKNLEFSEIINNNSLTWKLQNNIFNFNPETISFKKDENIISISNNIELFSGNSGIKIYKDKNLIQGTIFINDNIEIYPDIFKINSSIEINNNLIINENSITITGDKINLINGGANIVLENNNILIQTNGENEIYDILLDADRNVNLIGKNNIELNFKNYSGVIHENFYQIVKGEYEMILPGGKIKCNSDEFVVSGDKINFGGFQFDKENSYIKGEIIGISNRIGSMNFDKDGLLFKSGQNYINLLRNDGLELASKLDLNLVSQKKVNIYSNREVFFGNDVSNIKVDNGIEITGLTGIRGIGKQIIFGWNNQVLSGENCVFLGGEKCNLKIQEKQLFLESQEIKLKTNLLGIYSKNIISESESTKIVCKNSWLEFERVYWNCKDIDIKSQKIRLEFEKNNLELGNHFQYVHDTNIFKVYEKGFQIHSKSVEFDFNLNIKGQVDIIPSKNLKLESSLGDIELKTQTSNIFLDGISKKIIVESDGDIYTKLFGKYTLLGNSYDMQIDKDIFVISRSNLIFEGVRGIFLETEGEFIIKSNNDIEISSQNNFEIDIEKEIKIKSEKYGDLLINEIGVEINSNGKLEINCLDFLGKINGRVKVNVERNLEVITNGKIAINTDETFLMNSKDSIYIKTNELIRLDGKELELEISEISLITGKIKLECQDYVKKCNSYVLRQSGFGECKFNCEGKIGFINTGVGHLARAVEIFSEENTHDESVFLGSRLGGVVIQGKKIKLDGELNVDRIKPQNKLLIESNIEVYGVKVGNNMFLESRGISCGSRENFEMRNIDLRVDGNIVANDVKFSRIESNKKVLDLVGEVRIQNELELMSGMRLKGGSIGERGREFMKIDLNDEHVWNTGIKIQGTKNGIEIDTRGTALKTNGVVEVGELILMNKNNDSGKMEELEEDDIEKIMKELRVEKQNGKLVLVNKKSINLEEMLMKILGILLYKK